MSLFVNFLFVFDFLFVLFKIAWQCCPLGFPLLPFYFMPSYLFVCHQGWNVEVNGIGSWVLPFIYFSHSCSNHQQEAIYGLPLRFDGIRWNFPTFKHAWYLGSCCCCCFFVFFVVVVLFFVVVVVFFCLFCFFKSWLYWWKILTTCMRVPDNL